MQTVSLASAKAHLSALIDAVEAGEDVLITRRGRAVARLIHEATPAEASPAFDFVSLRTFVDAQPMQGGGTVEAMRRDSRY